ncbi:TPA: hypothetical protein HA361_02420 [Candidatus Woesearchaeota archaeon]|nr:hypothetical protein [Candidatus Woesearchaeota archaeon]
MRIATMRSAIFVAIAFMLASFAYAACPTGGINVGGADFCCGTQRDYICPNDFGADCSEDPDCTAVSGEDPPIIHCGDADIGGVEQCDTQTFITGQTCETEFSAAEGGSLTCTAACTLSDASCSYCGNTVLDADQNEVCDGAILGGQTCVTQGFASGTLACSSDCRSYDTSNCLPNPPGDCGDGNINQGEVCDTNGAGPDVMGGETCASQPEYEGGALLCANNCLSFDTSLCHKCGNGVVDAGEACDIDAPVTSTCANEGLGSGTLSCNYQCTGYDTSQCTADTSPPVIGDCTPQSGITASPTFSCPVTDEAGVGDCRISAEEGSYSEMLVSEGANACSGCIGGDRSCTASCPMSFTPESEGIAQAYAFHIACVDISSQENGNTAGNNKDHIYSYPATCVPAWGEWSSCSCTPSACGTCTGIQTKSDSNECAQPQTQDCAISTTSPPSGVCGDSQCPGTYACISGEAVCQGDKVYSCGICGGCSGSQYCDSGVQCVAKKTNGQSCSLPLECQSNSCVCGTCSGQLTRYYYDNDNDGYAASADNYFDSCSPQGKFTAISSSPPDCGDSNPIVHPGAQENADVVCGDTLDNNCDGNTDCVDSQCRGKQGPSGGGNCCQQDSQCGNDFACNPDLTSPNPNQCINAITASGISESCCLAYSECVRAAGIYTSLNGQNKADKYRISEAFRLTGADQCPPHGTFPSYRASDDNLKCFTDICETSALHCIQCGIVRESLYTGANGCKGAIESREGVALPLPPLTTAQLTPYLN